MPYTPHLQLRSAKLLFLQLDTIYRFPIPNMSCKAILKKVFCIIVQELVSKLIDFFLSASQVSLNLKLQWENKRQSWPPYPLPNSKYKIIKIFRNSKNLKHLSITTDGTILHNADPFQLDHIHPSNHVTGPFELDQNSVSAKEKERVSPPSPPNISKICTLTNCLSHRMILKCSVGVKQSLSACSQKF